MGKVTIVSVTYENVAILIKIVLPYFSGVFLPPVWSLSGFTAISFSFGETGFSGLEVIFQRRVRVFHRGFQTREN